MTMLPSGEKLSTSPTPMTLKNSSMSMSLLATSILWTIFGQTLSSAQSKSLQETPLPLSSALRVNYGFVAPSECV